MNRILTYQIPEEYENYKLHTFLSDLGYASRILTCLRKDENLVHINGVPSFLNTILHYDDQVEIRLLETEKDTSVITVKLDFDIVYEDEDMIVINKPYQMPIHPSINNYTNSLANALAYYYKDEASPFVFRCINRLDRDTSGLTIVAKNALSASILGTMMKEREIEKTYLAIVCGSLENKIGTINAPIRRKTESCIERCVDYENGETAITHYQVVKEFYYHNSSSKDNVNKSITSSENSLLQNSISNLYSLVSLHLETGRTHQIRVHMKSIGHPLIGDFLYNPEDTTMTRQALHADTIKLHHPITGELLELSAPLPEDMKHILS